MGSGGDGPTLSGASGWNPGPDTTCRGPGPRGTFPRELTANRKQAGEGAFQEGGAGPRAKTEGAAGACPEGLPHGPGMGSWGCSGSENRMDGKGPGHGASPPPGLPPWLAATARRNASCDHAGRPRDPTPRRPGSPRRCRRRQRADPPPPAAVPAPPAHGSEVRGPPYRPPARRPARREPLLRPPARGQTRRDLTRLQSRVPSSRPPPSPNARRLWKLREPPTWRLRQALSPAQSLAHELCLRNPASLRGLRELTGDWRKRTYPLCVTALARFAQPQPTPRPEGIPDRGRSVGEAWRVRRFASSRTLGRLWALPSCACETRSRPPRVGLSSQRPVESGSFLLELTSCNPGGDVTASSEAGVECCTRPPRQPQPIPHAPLETAPDANARYRSPGRTWKA
ncbi:uncharacterized protein [Notamacropus eugenii]|uniref:uncharacterized protein n=1 Tax=Notamacropus eugenii TaxID=9315 RepID=UPI003B66FFB7